jgi:MATE family multidrug resistance protein
VRQHWPHLSPACLLLRVQVLRIVLACLPPLLISLVGDGINVVLSGCIRGAGKQALGSLVNLGSFWCFGLPLSALLALRWGWGAPGLWWGMAVTSSVQAAVLAGVTCCMDWRGEAARSKRLVRSQSSSHGGGG